MKKLMILAAAAVIAGSLAGCSPANSDGSTPAAEAVSETSIAHYITFKENALYTYSTNTTNYPTWQMYYDYIGDDLLQRRIIMPTDTVAEILSLADNSLTLTSSVYGFAHHLDARDIESNTYARVLQEPLEVGATWIQAVSDEQDITVEVTAADVEVEVPYGTFSTLEITTTYISSGTVQKDYYAPGVGLVKTISYGSATVITELESIEENYSMEEEVEIFLTGGGSDIKTISYSTDNDVLALYNQLWQEVAKESYGFTPGGDLINSLSFDYGDEYVLHVDLTAEAVEDISRYGDDEDALQCIASTLGGISACDSVIITAEGEAYSSENLSLEKDYAFEIEHLVTMVLPGGERTKVAVSYGSGSTVGIYNQLWQNAAPEYYGITPSGDLISSISSGSEDYTLIIDLTSAALADISAAGNDEAVLQSIASTFGGINSCIRVGFTVEGAAYQSANLSLAEGYMFEVDYGI